MSESYIREHRIRMVHRLTLRNIPVELIAQQMGLPVHTIYELRKDLNSRLRYEARNVDAMSYIGQSMAFYGEVQSMALRLASDNKTPVNGKVAALMAALAAKNGEARFMERAGFFQHNRFTPSNTGAAAEMDRSRKQIDVLVDISARVLRGEDMDDYEPPAEMLQTDDERLNDDIKLLGV